MSLQPRALFICFAAIFLYKWCSGFGVVIFLDCAVCTKQMLYINRVPKPRKWPWSVCLKVASCLDPLCVVVVFDLFELARRLKALTRLVWIGPESECSDPFGFKVGTQILSRTSWKPHRWEIQSLRPWSAWSGRVNPFESSTVWPKLAKWFAQFLI